MHQKTALALALAIALPAFADTDAPPAAATETLDSVVITLGTGETRQVQRISQKNLDVLPPGTSPQKLLNILPGVNAQSVDALGGNEQSLTLSLRGFNSTRLGYTLDGMPLGDSAYNNYNGLSISRALISENLAGAEVAVGIANLGLASTSNLGGAIAYTSGMPQATAGARATQTLGSDGNRRTFLRLDSGEFGGMSFYLSGSDAVSDLWNDQQAYRQSTTKQFNGKARLRLTDATITGYVATVRTVQANDFYLSKNEMSRGLGWDWGGYAPDWNKALSRAYCNAGTLVAAKCDSSGADKDADGAFTAGQISRYDTVMYLSGDLQATPDLKLHAQAYHHTDSGAGNNWNSGSWSNLGTAQQLPLIIRATLYSIDREGGIVNAAWDVGSHHVEAGFWGEFNTSEASRYNYTNVTGPRDLGGLIGGQPNVGVFDQRTKWATRQFFLKDTISLLDDRLTIDIGAKGQHSTSDAQALPGIAKTAIAASSNNQFATGRLVAKDSFLPSAGVRFELAPGQEVFASFAENMAMFQGGFKLGPQAVSQATWNAQTTPLAPEKSRSLEGGYRYTSKTLQASAAIYDVQFDNRLLQYNPCDSRQPVGPSCGNRFYNVGGVSSRGAELTVQWLPSSQWRWYNSVSLNRSTYDSDYTQAGVVQPTRGKTQVDTPRLLLASELTYARGGWSTTLRGKFTGERFYTYTNDQGFGGYTTFDLGSGYDFGRLGFASNVRVQLNISNLTDKRYASNLDNSVFAPTDPNGTIYVFHASAPRQVFASVDVRF